MSGTNTKKGPVYDPGTCRCCGASKKCRLLNVEYEHSNKKEIYSDMFVECFGLVLSHLDGEPIDRLICAMCVSRLREAASFRLQVLQCEEKLLQARFHMYDAAKEVEPPMEIKTEVFIKEEVASDEAPSDDGGAEVGNSNVEVPPESVNPRSLRPRVHRPDYNEGRPALELKGKSSSEEDHLKAKKQLLLRIQRMKERLKRMHRAKEKKPAPYVDEESLSFQNNVVLVEGSYACPFQTAYSSYYCAYCQATFGDVTRLREHTLKHDPNQFKEIVSKKPTYLDIERIDCRHCDERISDINVFKAHIVDKHGRKLNNVKDEILKFRLKNGAIPCTECNKTFLFFHALKRHMAEHFGSFVCDICGAHYFDRRTLDNHCNNSHKDRERHSCHECGKLFKSKHTMYMHVSSVHKKEAAFQCSKCDATLFSYRERVKHMLDAHGEARAHPCESCGKVFASRKNLREHSRAVHLRAYRHCCALCGRGYAQPQRLADHVAAMHRSGRSYYCDLCGNSYPRLHYLRLHIQSHQDSPHHAAQS